MNRPFSRLRRFAIAAVALALAFVLFRPQVAQALIVRGDEFLYRGNTSAALERYQRALALMPESQTAADRYAFLSLQRNTPSSLRRAITIAGRYLRRHPDDAVLLTDRALCYLHQKRYALAQNDFEHAARSSHAPESFVFAGWAAEHAGRAKSARTLWRLALAVRRGYRPALIALSEHGQ
jgi:tetratricopeptide (TPR) repeat protein